MSTKFIFNDITLVKQNPRNDQTFTLSLLCRSYSFFEALGFHYSFSRERKKREREREQSGQMRFPIKRKFGGKKGQGTIPGNFEVMGPNN